MDNKQNPLRNWQDLRREFFKQVPLSASGHGIESFVNRAINDIMQHAMPLKSVFQPFPEEEELEYELFESQQVIFVRCRVPDQRSPHDFRFFVSRSKLRLECQGTTREIRLPHAVTPSQAFAKMDGEVVEVCMPRSHEPEPYLELAIQD